MFRRAAEAGSADGMEALGRCYRDGFGLDADAAQAELWFSRAAAARATSGRKAPY